MNYKKVFALSCACLCLLTGCSAGRDRVMAEETLVTDPLPQSDAAANTTAYIDISDRGNTPTETVSETVAGTTAETTAAVPKAAQKVAANTTVSETAPTVTTTAVTTVAPVLPVTEVQSETVPSPVTTAAPVPETTVTAEAPAASTVVTADEQTEYDYDFFRNDLFIGDSISTGYSLYGFLKDKNVFAKVGLNPNTVLTKRVSTCYGDLYVADMLHYTKPERVYVMLGSNGIQWLSNSAMISSIDSLVGIIQEASPDSKIYLISVTPVTPGYDSTVEDVDVMEKINEYNADLKDFAEEKGVIFINVAEDLKDEYGYFSSAFAESDGMHFKPGAYKVVLSKIERTVKELDEAALAAQAEAQPEDTVQDGDGTAAEKKAVKKKTDGTSSEKKAEETTVTAEDKTEEETSAVKKVRKTAEESPEEGTQANTAETAPAEDKEGTEAVAAAPSELDIALKEKPAASGS
ncbi:MAG: hypothetical protein IJ149_10805 [Oscillospiraceae bacterium]|nr:hypothetical protein [Oscillospiraceae bacterium]MBQ9210047.1 hypothetical protein [Oscillospiraceae bacterium]